MAAEDRRHREPELEPDLEPDVHDAEEMEVSRFQALLQDRRKLISGLVLVLVLIVAIYVLFPKIVGADEAVDKLDEATWYWILVAIGFNVLAFGAYVALFRGVLGGTRDDEVHRRLDLRASYLITMAGLAATRIFAAGGAGGIALTAAIDPSPLAIGGNGAALGLLCAWAVPDLLARARGQEYDGDLLGTLVLALVLLLMPLATVEASAIAGFAGGAAGQLAGLVLARMRSA